MSLKSFVFGYRGRITLKQFIKKTFISGLILMISVITLKIICALFGISNEIFDMLSYIPLIIFSYRFCCLVARRLHDVGKSGFIGLLAFIPIVNFYVLFNIIKVSEKGENKYGTEQL